MTRWAPDIDDVFVRIDFWDWMTTGDVLRNPEELDWTAMQKIFLAFQKFNNILLPLLRHILQATQQQRASYHPRHLPDQRGPPGESHWKLILLNILVLELNLTSWTSGSTGPSSTTGSSTGKFMSLPASDFFSLPSPTFWLLWLTFPLTRSFGPWLCCRGLLAGGPPWELFVDGRNSNDIEENYLWLGSNGAATIIFLFTLHSLKKWQWGQSSFIST